MKKSALVVLTLIAFFSLSSCNNNAKNVAEETKGIDELKNTTIDGMINGQNWVFISGRAKPSFFNKTEYMIELFDKSLQDPCNDFKLLETRTVLTSVELKKGAISFDMNNNATLAYNENGTSMNIIATEGMLVLDSVEGDFIEGKMLAKFDSKNHVNGAFRIPICP